MSDPQSKPSSGISLVVSKPSVATSQLETAIQLWFDEGDPVSIHTLAVAAHDCFNALSTFTGRLSLTQQWLKKLPAREQKWLTEAQNFFKHGHRFPKRKLRYFPHHAELLMYDSCLCFEHLAKKIRPLMEVYLLRFMITYPKHLKLSVPLEDLIASRGIKLSEVAPLSRREFLQRVLPSVSRFLALKYSSSR